MLQTTLTNLIIAYLVIVTGTLGLFWFLQNYRRRRREYHERSRYILCRICGETFEIDTGEMGDLATCPHCQSVNEREKFREI